MFFGPIINAILLISKYLQPTATRVEIAIYLIFCFFEGFFLALRLCKLLNVRALQDSSRVKKVSRACAHWSTPNAHF